MNTAHCLSCNQPPLSCLCYHSTTPPYMTAPIQKLYQVIAKDADGYFTLHHEFITKQENLERLEWIVVLDYPGAFAYTQMTDEDIIFEGPYQECVAYADGLNKLENREFRI